MVCRGCDMTTVFIRIYNTIRYIKGTIIKELSERTVQPQSHCLFTHNVNWN